MSVCIIKKGSHKVIMDPKDFRVNIGFVSVSMNNVMSFVLKEECPDKISDKNTYIIKIQGIEMGNLTRVEKVKIEDGVYHFTVDLSQIEPALENGENTLEVEGTSNMLVTGAGSLNGLYSLTCGEETLSIYSGNGVYISLKGNNTAVNSSIIGFYSRRVVSSDRVIYEKFTNGNKFVIFYYAPKQRWYIKQTILNGAPDNTIYYQENTSSGNPEEVPLNNWTIYTPGGYPPNRCSKISELGMRSCIPFDGASADVILVNCGGIDEVNGCYYKDVERSRFVNTRNKNYIIRYVVNQQTAESFWQIQDISNVSEGGSLAALYRSQSIISIGNSVFGSCIPCCDWVKENSSSPGDPPQVTALEYYDPITPSHFIRYFDNGSSTWSFFNKTEQIATGTSDHYVVVRSDSTAPDVNGVYCLTCVNPDSCPDYTKVMNTDVLLGYNTSLKRWEIRTSSVPGVDVIYFSNSKNSSVPPFDDWVRDISIGGNTPLVLSSMVPSSITWTLL
jgi:hypothetical protein